MLKLKEIDQELIEKHLKWCVDNLKPKLKESKIQFLNVLAEDDIFEEIIVSKNLKEVIKKWDLDKKYKEASKEHTVKENNKSKNQINEFFRLRYEAFSKKDTKINKNWNRHIFLARLNVTTCPYCNRQYITKYAEDLKESEDIDNRTTADLDHFYSQSEYPYLALSIYNFIPSCQICNRNFKKDKEIGIYPYEEEFGNDAIFELKFKNKPESFLIPSSEDDFIIGIKVNGNREKINKNIKIFKLKKVYRTAHNKYVKNMLDTFESYPEEYIEEIKDLFGRRIETRKRIKVILKDMLKKPYLFKIENNEPLGKLTNDILRSYGILKEDE